MAAARSRLFLAFEEVEAARLVSSRRSVATVVDRYRARHAHRVDCWVTGDRRGPRTVPPAARSRRKAPRFPPTCAADCRWKESAHRGSGFA